MPPSTVHRPPFLDHHGPIPIAHRGGASEAPENSLAAFAGAIARGYRYLETDVHVTADGVLVAFHDTELDRVTDATGRIADLPWSVVSQARIDGREPIPRFDELLETFPEVRIAVDPKVDGAVVPLARTLQQHGAIDRVCVGSFSDRRIRRIRELLGLRVCTGLGPRAAGRLRAASLGSPVGRIVGHVAQVPYRYRGRAFIDERFVVEAHRRGLAVHVWTVDEPADMHQLLDWGVDGIMTDRPEVLLEVLAGRGQWAPGH